MKNNIFVTILFSCNIIGIIFFESLFGWRENNSGPDDRSETKGVFSDLPALELRNDSITFEQYCKLRSAKLKYEKIIRNSDGDDIVTYPRSEDFSVSTYLSLRTSPLKGSDITTISYCTSRAFGSYLHNTKVGIAMYRDTNDYFPYKDKQQMYNSKFLFPNKYIIPSAIPEFAKMGTDPLAIQSKFARKVGFEFFWSKRMNDTHDVSHTPEYPHPHWSRFKEENPQFLFGKIGEKLPHGRWSSVDYSYPEIRNMCYEVFTEVCENYDVDGIELDFCRHLEIFRSVGLGGVATDQQREMLTDMIFQIRRMTERVGMKKGKPILIAIRVPDSFEYCKDIGIDLENWMQNGLIDMVIGSDYFRLNTWEYLVNMGRKYNINTYAGLSESRVKNEHPILKRNQVPVFRARCNAAWQCGVNGLYLFNQSNPKTPYFSEVGSSKKLKDKNKLYFITYRNGNPNKYLKDGVKYANLPNLTPQKPVTIKRGETITIGPVEIGEENSETANLYLILYADQLDTKKLKININDQPVFLKKVTEDKLTVFIVPPQSIKEGHNELRISYGKDSKTSSGKLLDIALFVLHDAEDPFTKKLVSLCQ